MEKQAVLCTENRHSYMAWNKFSEGELGNECQNFKRGYHLAQQLYLMECILRKLLDMCPKMYFKDINGWAIYKIKYFKTTYLPIQDDEIS